MIIIFTIGLVFAFTMVVMVTAIAAFMWLVYKFLFWEGHAKQRRARKSDSNH